MIRRENGFTLVELMITIVIFLIVIVAASQVFTGLLTQFKQQSKIAETNIEGVVGLEIFRRDLENAGYGLPWDLNGAAYTEVDNTATIPALTAQNDESFNDGPPNNPARGTDTAGASHPPGALRSGNGGGVAHSDVLVIKAVNIAVNATSSKWTHLFAGNTVTKWMPATERLVSNDRVIVLRPLTTRVLVNDGGRFTSRYNANTDPTPDNLIDPAGLADDNFAPPNNTETRVVYGIAPPADPVTTALRMPFNRADYYIRRPATNMPSRCATNEKTTFTPGTLTGILYKGTVNQGTGATAGGGLSEMPLLDCVADMQVVYALDSDANGTIDTYSDDISLLTAAQIRDRVKEVRVYILAHEGQKDPNYTYTTNPVYVGESLIGAGRDFDFTNPDGDAGTADGIVDWQNYRWKLYTLVIKTKNLR